MATDEQGRIEELCQRIRVEQDLNALCELIEELNRPLETTLENARSSGKRKPEIDSSANRKAKTSSAKISRCFGSPKGARSGLKNMRVHARFTSAKVRQPLQGRQVRS